MLNFLGDIKSAGFDGIVSNNALGNGAGNGKRCACVGCDVLILCGFGNGVSNAAFNAVDINAFAVCKLCSNLNAAGNITCCAADNGKVRGILFGVYVYIDLELCIVVVACGIFGNALGNLNAGANGKSKSAVVAKPDDNLVVLVDIILIVCAAVVGRSVRQLGRACGIGGLIFEHIVQTAYSAGLKTNNGDQIRIAD